MKKSLKSIIITAIFLIGGILIIGCGRNTSPNNLPPDQPTSTTEEKKEVSSDTTDSEKKGIILDSINNRVTDLNSIVNGQTTAIDTNRKTIDDIKTNYTVSILVLWGAAVISLIISILALIKAKAAITRAGRHRQEIEDLKRSLAESEARLMNVSRNNDITYSSVTRRDLADLSSRIYRIERQLERPVEPHSQNISSKSRADESASVNSPQLNEQYGYFGLPSKMSETEAYFKRMVDTRDSESRFQVVVRNEIAEFRPLEGTQYLNDLRSSDTIKMALDIRGCAPSVASHMSVINCGEAKLIEGRWVITKNAIIALS